MIYRISADAILSFHLAFIVFVVFGAGLVIRLPRVAWLHLSALAWGVWIELSHGICPLTPLENGLRSGSGESGYSGGFIEHYLVPIIYPKGLDASDQIVLAVLLVTGNALAYAWAWVRRRRARV